MSRQNRTWSDDRSRKRRLAAVAVGVTVPVAALALSLYARAGSATPLGVRSVGQTAQPASGPTTSSTAPSAPTPSSTTVPPQAANALPPSDPRALSACQARLVQYTGVANPFHVSLLAAYASSASGVAAQDEQRQGAGSRSAFRDRQPGEFEAVCWFDSNGFGVPAVAVANDAAAKAAPDRIEEVVRPDGVPVREQSGKKTSLTPSPVPVSGVAK